jgi:hypothetical protein
LRKNMKYIRYVFSEYEGFVARTGGVARTGPILYLCYVVQKAAVMGNVQCVAIKPHNA